MFTLDYYNPRGDYLYADDNDSDGLSGGAIAGISVGSVLFVIIIITMLIVALILVRSHYVKQQNLIGSVTNTNTITADESSDMVPPYPMQPPVYISTQPSAVCYAKSNDFMTTPPRFNESLPEYSPSNPPPAYASNDETPTTQDVVQ